MTFFELHYRGTSKEEQCCAGIDLWCHGCNPVLHADGQECEDQTEVNSNWSFWSKSNSDLYKDCFCDTSCIFYEDCCEDHFDTCNHLYDENETGTNNWEQEWYADCEYIKEKELFFHVE